MIIKKAFLSSYNFVTVGTLALELQHTRLINQPPEMKRTGSRRQQLELPKGLTLQNLQKRPSIAPVPAVVEASDITINVQDEDTMSEESFPFMDDEDDPGFVITFSSRYLKSKFIPNY